MCKYEQCCVDDQDSQEGAFPEEPEHSNDSDESSSDEDDGLPGMSGRSTRSLTILTYQLTDCYHHSIEATTAYFTNLFASPPEPLPEILSQNSTNASLCPPSRPMSKQSKLSKHSSKQSRATTPFYPSGNVSRATTPALFKSSRPTSKLDTKRNSLNK